MNTAVRWYHLQEVSEMCLVSVEGTVPYSDSRPIYSFGSALFSPGS
jgi:hypothetical protein